MDDRDLDRLLERWADRRRGEPVAPTEAEAMVARWHRRRVRRQRATTIAITSSVLLLLAVPFILPVQPAPEGPSTAWAPKASSKDRRAPDTAPQPLVRIKPAVGKRRMVQARDSGRLRSFQVGEVVLSSGGSFEVIGLGGSMFEVRASDGPVLLVASKVTIPVGARVRIDGDTAKVLADLGHPETKATTPKPRPALPRRLPSSTHGTKPKRARAEGLRPKTSGSVYKDPVEEDVSKPSPAAEPPEGPTVEGLELEALSALQRGEAGRASALFAEAAALTHGVRRAGLQFAQGKALFSDGRFAEAARAFEGAARDFGPDHALAVDAQVRWAEAALASGDKDRAITILRTILRTRPGAAGAERAADLLESLSP